MQTALVFAAVLIGALIVFAGAVAFRLWRRFKGRHLRRGAFEAHRELIEPHLKTRYPPGSGPFPAVLLFHGCGGVRRIMHAYADAAAKAGVAAIIVDSHTPRGIDYEAALAQVCTGRRLWARERAADLHAALAVARDDPRIDETRLALAGWSHGGWTILDAFALQASDEAPDGLDEPPARAFEGVKAVFLVYPYVSGPALARRRDFTPPAPIEAVLVEDDAMASDADASEVLSRLKKQGAAVSWSSLGGVTHGFDEPDHHPESKLLYDAEATARTRADFIDMLQRRLHPRPV
jgi:dienelactone hydrolase